MSPHIKTDMHDNHFFADSQWAVVPALLGGMGSYFLKISVHPYLVSLGQAALTAFVCGVAGVAGKEIYNFVKKRIKKNDGQTGGNGKKGKDT